MKKKDTMRTAEYRRIRGLFQNTALQTKNNMYMRMCLLCHLTSEKKYVMK
jgi:hypothetical protein